LAKNLIQFSYLVPARKLLTIERL